MVTEFLLLQFTFPFAANPNSNQLWGKSALRDLLPMVLLLLTCRAQVSWLLGVQRHFVVVLSVAGPPWLSGWLRPLFLVYWSQWPVSLLCSLSWFLFLRNFWSPSAGPPSTPTSTEQLTLPAFFFLLPSSLFLQERCQTLWKKWDSILMRGKLKKKIKFWNNFKFQCTFLLLTLKALVSNRTLKGLTWVWHAHWNEDREISWNNSPGSGDKDFSWQ